jgi:NADH:ubiquinone oxidoreductase subunit 5 (subunit L)/multisubunit Na+/H+ antiporter MnhA subunit
MEPIKIRAGFTIFLLFFGIALLEAFSQQNWLMAIFWVATGVIFYLLDRPKHHRSKTK